MQGTERAGGTGGAARAANLPQIVLQITRGRAKHKSRPIRSSAFLIGSAPDCDLVLSDLRFDPVHSYLIVRPMRVTIRQLGVGPPLCIDGQQVTWAALAEGDRLQMGNYEFQIRIEWPQRVLDGRAGSTTAESVPLDVDRDQATERLLCDVEQFSEVPRLSLFVGDEPQGAVVERPLPLSDVDPRAWRQTPKKASF